MKLLKILMISFCIIIISQNVFAIGEILDMEQSWEDIGKQYAESGKTMDTKALIETSNNLYGILLTAATVIAVIIGAILGIKFMAAGIDEKVQVKQSLFPYLISCIVVFGSFGIWKLVVTIMSEL